MKKTILFLSIVAILSSCKPDMDVPDPQAGNADFTRYVALGNSLTSGFADGALYKSGQENSYPNMLAKQMQLVGGANQFNIPWSTENGAGSDPVNGRRYLGYGTDCLGNTSLGPKAHPADLSIFASNIYLGTGFNNMGIPGCKAVNINFHSYGNPANGAGNYNPFYARIASNPNASILDDAMAMNPTFFTLWIGNNDILFYALSGGMGSTPGFGSNDISPEATFTTSIRATLDTLYSIGAKGVVANIPDITTIPYITTVPYNGLTLDAGTANLLNIGNGGLTNFTEGKNAFIVQETSGTIRSIQSDEYVLLTVPFDSIKCAFWGASMAKPIPDQYWLERSEIDAIESATTTFNNILKIKAAEYDFGFADMNAVLKNFKNGIMYDGVEYSAAFVTGGVFSLDGVHPNAKGYAICANEFIKVINDKYKSTLPPVQVNDYPGIVFP